MTRTLSLGGRIGQAASDVTIGILIGGRSSRMGRPKALLAVDGGTLIERTLTIAREVADQVVLLGEPVFELPETLQGVANWPDAHASIGPIGGLHALISGMETPWGLLVACDMPFLSPSLLRWIAGVARGTMDDAVVPVTEDPAVKDQFDAHPCCAAFRAQTRDTITTAIAEGRYSMNGLLQRLSVQALPLRGDDARQLENWNQPSDVIHGAGGGCSVTKGCCE